MSRLCAITALVVFALASILDAQTTYKVRDLGLVSPQATLLRKISFSPPHYATIPFRINDLGHAVFFEVEENRDKLEACLEAVASIQQ